MQASIASRLPSWGPGVFELSTYAASISLFAFGKPLLPIVNGPKGFIPVLALQRSFTPGEGWRSGFAIAPQLGCRNFGVGYVVAQAERRLAPVLTGSGGPPLDVTVERAAGEAVMSCEPPKPRRRRDDVFHDRFRAFDFQSHDVGQFKNLGAHSPRRVRSHLRPGSDRHGTRGP